jgi:hypothetical protein
MVSLPHRFFKPSPFRLGVRNRSMRDVAAPHALDEDDVASDAPRLNLATQRRLARGAAHIIR